MNLQEILKNIFSFGSSYEAAAFSLILIITGILATLLYHLLFNAPRLKKLKTESAQLKNELSSTESKYKLLDEKYNVQLSKTKRTEDEAAKAAQLSEEFRQKFNLLEAKSEQITFDKNLMQRRAENAEKEIQELKNLYKINEQDALASEEKLQQVLTERDEAVSKLEDFKNMMEELERERFNASGNAEDALKKAAESKALADRLLRDTEALKQENLKLKSQIEEKELQLLDFNRLNSLHKQQILALQLKIETFEKDQRQIGQKHRDDYPESEVHFQNQDQNELFIPMEEESEEPISTATVVLSDDFYEENYGLNQENKMEAVKIADDADLKKEAELRAMLQLLFASVAEEEADDLKQISGIDVESEEKLNNIGIRSYEHIIKLSDAHINHKICVLLTLKEGSIEKDQWVAQARQLLTRQKINKLTRDINLNKLFKK